MELFFPHPALQKFSSSVTSKCQHKPTTPPSVLHTAWSRCSSQHSSASLHFFIVLQITTLGHQVIKILSASITSLLQEGYSHPKALPSEW